MMKQAWVIAFLCAAGIVAHGQKAAPRSGRKPMELELKIGKTQFILKESLRLEVIVHNRGSGAVSVPAIADSRNRALSYRLMGSSFPKELVFQYAGPDAMTIPGGPAMLTVESGGSVSVPISIEKYWTDWKPGAHKLRAILNWGGESIESNLLLFEILNPEVKSGQVIVDSVSSSSESMRAVFLVSAGGVNRLYQGFFREARPGLETRPESNFTEAFEVPATATSVAALWADFDRRSAMVSPRYVWLRGHSAAVQEFQSPPVTLDLGEEKLMRPGVLTRDADALLVSWNGSHAMLTRVPRKGAPSKVWDATLPFSAADGRVWLTPEGKVTVVFAAERSNTVSMFLVQEGQVIATTEIENAVLLPQSEPGLAIASDGTIRASVLVAEPEQRRRISTVEWKWKHGEPGVAPERQRVVDLAQDPRAAAVVYTFSAGVPRRDWVILYGSEIIVTNRSPGRSRILDGTPILPLQLLPRAQTSYLLVKHPREIVYLAPMF